MTVTAVALELDTSEEAARRALGIVWGGAEGWELVELSVLKRKKWRSVHCSVAEALAGAGDGVAAMRRASAEGAAAYFGACTLKERPPRGRRGSAGIRSTAGALWVDVDCRAPGREGSAYFANVAEALAEVDRALDEVLGAGAAQRMLIVGSGWGLQVWAPLDRRVPAGDGARMSRLLVEEVAARVSGKVDQLSDVSRVMRMPGGWNWRAGGREEDAAATGVLRWPGGAGAFKADGLRQWLEGRAAERGAVAVAVGGGGAGGELLGSAGGGPLLDVETLCDRVLTWADVLVPAGWTRSDLDRGIAGWSGGVEVEVWARPGRAGERSAVVYRDGGGALCVYSDSPDTGFGAGLLARGGRGGGAGAAGVGVISRWRALVALAYGGDRERALSDVWAGVGALGAAWTEEWEVAGEVVGEWCELAQGFALGYVQAKTQWYARQAAAAAAASAEGVTA